MLKIEDERHILWLLFVKWTFVFGEIFVHLFKEVFSSQVYYIVDLKLVSVATWLTA